MASLPVRLWRFDERILMNDSFTRGKYTLKASRITSQGAAIFL